MLNNGKRMVARTWLDVLTNAGTSYSRIVLHRLSTRPKTKNCVLMSINENQKYRTPGIDIQR